jgi:thioesterase domain-containing protein
VAEPAGESDPALVELHRRLDQAALEASALLGEIPPAGGWQRPEDDGAATDEDALARLLARLAQIVPPDIWERLAAALRELLLALRALIDWYLERSERRTQPVEVRDIPIL